jgi:hypothetical protein
MGRRVWRIVGVLLVLAASAGAQEAPRRIRGSGVDLIFAEDMVYGSVGGRPVWANYRCARDIQGVMEGNGTRVEFAFACAAKGAPRVVSGTFGGREAALERILPVDQGFVYDLSLGEDLLEFHIHCSQDAQGHLENPVIEGRLPGRKSVRLAVDGRLCPFATMGVILIVTGALAAF